MRAVQHIDLYLSSTDKCIIDANCWDSILFGSPFIFPTRYLVHQVLSWSWNTQLGSSNAVFHSKCISCYYIQLHFPKHQRMRQTAPDQLQWQDHPSCVSAVQDNVWNNLKAEYCPPAIVTPLLQEVQLWSSYASISRVFAHPACRYRFLIDKYETEVSLVHNCQNKFHSIQSEQCFPSAQRVFSSFGQFLQDRTCRQVSFLGITFIFTAT